MYNGYDILDVLYSVWHKIKRKNNIYKQPIIIITCIYFVGVYKNEIIMHCAIKDSDNLSHFNIL